MTLNTRKRPYEQLYDQSTGYITEARHHERKAVVDPDAGRYGMSTMGQNYQPQVAAEIFIAKFAKLWAAGHTSREKTISVL